ncbi:calcium uptake protein 2, mitochondrial [Nannospalax galili]|uniref:calcium uptake protein 2, mitochondrial n=1 Tax=Nannospalax galili TaxID=1026970 RepID=UPI00111C0CBC|nr:calcium uptake protein 2, mitochondrial [Nannospalax galili]
MATAAGRSARLAAWGGRLRRRLAASRRAMPSPGPLAAVVAGVALGGAGAAWHHGRVKVAAREGSLTVLAQKNDCGPIEKLSLRKQRFMQFSSLEHNGEYYMTPRDFLFSVMFEQIERKTLVKKLAKKDVEDILTGIQTARCGSTFFRDLGDKGVISYTEYLFLLTILTKPHTGFHVAFKMLDADGNEMIERKEFFKLQKIISKQDDFKTVKTNEPEYQEPKMKEPEINTTLQMRFFLIKLLVARYLYNQVESGSPRLDRNWTCPASLPPLPHNPPCQRPATQWEEWTLAIPLTILKLNVTSSLCQFCILIFRFMENLQTEIQEMEFLQFSKGLNFMRKEDFAEWLLFFTNSENKEIYWKNVREKLSAGESISLDEFKSFCHFTTHLEDFAIAMQMFSLAHRPVRLAEFKRAVKATTGQELSNNILDTVFKIFDLDGDDCLSHGEFLGVLKNRMHRGLWVSQQQNIQEYWKCVKKESIKGVKEVWKQAGRGRI